VPQFAAERGHRGTPGSAIETVVASLRDWGVKKFGGWVPEIEGNRKMYGIIGFPQTKSMATGQLTPVATNLWHPLPASGAGEGVRVGVVDTGLYPNPLLAGHYIPYPDDRLGASASGREPAWDGHAAMITGLIATQAPGCQIIVRKALDEDGRATVWDTALKLANLADENLDVVNLSLGINVAGSTPPLALRRAVRLFSDRTVVVAAAGNHGATSYNTLPTWPAAMPGVLAVGATIDPDLSGGGDYTLAPISPDLPWVDCVAPGVDVVSTFLETTVVDKAGKPVVFHGVAQWSGTSLAAANASGAIAARTGQGVKSRDALRSLLNSSGPIVRRYAWKG
jgi:hypothetical protein